MNRMRTYTFSANQTCANKLLAFMYCHFAYRFPPVNKQNGKLLDIGCGTGEYLSMLKEMGWRVSGIEIGKAASNYAKARGLDVINADFQEIREQKERFDAITMWHSLEHFSQPAQVIRKARKLLKDDGVLLIGIPNHDSLDRILFKDCWNGFEIPLHLYHFSPKSIRLMMKLNGFECERIIHTIRPSDMASSMIAYLENHFGPINGKHYRFLTCLCFLIAIVPSFVFSLCQKSSIIMVQVKPTSRLNRHDPT